MRQAVCSLSLRERVGVRGSWPHNAILRLEAGSVLSPANSVPNDPLTPTLSRRKREL